MLKIPNSPKDSSSAYPKVPQRLGRWLHQGLPQLPKRRIAANKARTPAELLETSLNGHGSILSKHRHAHELLT